MFTMASIARFTRSEMIEVLDSDYMLLAVLGPGMNSYTYSGQDLSQKNFAPRVPGIEQFGILDGSEKMSTTTGTKVTNAYQEKTSWTSTTGSAAICTAATSGPVHGKVPGSP